MENFNLIDLDSRIVALPIGRPALYELYKKAFGSFWDFEHIDFSTDMLNYTNLNDDVKTALTIILAWFASSDGRIVVNLSERFIKEVPIYEAIRFYNIQNAMEDIHAFTYAKNIEAIIPDEKTRQKLFNACDEMPIIKRMNDYVIESTESDERLAIRLIKFVCIEGIWFTGCFAFIDWMKERSAFDSTLNMPGTFYANEYISRDEGLHTEFGIEILKLLKPEAALTEQEAIKYITEAMEIAYDFISAMLPRRALVGMNQDLMRTHIQSKADDIMIKLGFKSIYNATTVWQTRGLQNKTSFFERRNSSYAKSTTASATDVDYDV